MIFLRSCRAGCKYKGQSRGQMSCSQEVTRKEGKAVTSPPSDILGGLDWSCQEALVRLPSSFCPLLQLQGRGKEMLPACFFWNTPAWMGAELSWKMVNAKYDSQTDKAKQTSWDFFSSKIISRLHPFFTWWNCKAKTPGSSVSVCWTLVARCLLVQCTLPHPTAARSFGVTYSATWHQQVSSGGARPVCKPGPLLNLQNLQGARDTKLAQLLLPLLPSLSV